jgi:hypothetical protein
MPGTHWENTEIQPRDLPQDFLQNIITHGIFADVSQPTKRKVQGDEVNHWRLFFAISADQSISLDMVKNAPDNPRGTGKKLPRVEHWRAEDSNDTRTRPDSGQSP